MALRKEDNTPLTVAGFKALCTVVATPETKYTVGENVWEDRDVQSSTRKDGGTKVLKYRAGSVITETVYNAPYAGLVVTQTSILPATGPAAGGTDVIIKGTNLNEVTGVTIGGAAATKFNNLNDTTITCTTPAHAAGAVSTVLAVVGGDITTATAFTYV